MSPHANDPSRRNNFDIVRLVLAWMVVAVHIALLSHQPALEFVPRWINTKTPVEGFFAISGFLIFASYERCSTLRQYATNRAWRILPGYWFATLVCLFIAFSFGRYHVLAFLIANLTFANFAHPGIPGLFQLNPEDTAVNGSLWTIKVEVMFYCAVPAIVWLCRKLNRDAVLVTLFILSFLFRMVYLNSKAGVQLPGQLCHFMVGALIFYHLQTFKKYGLWFVLAAAAMEGVYLWTGWYWPRPFAIGVLTLGACQLLPHIEGPTRWGDFSYGTYVLHWPIIQTLVSLNIFRLNLAIALCVIVGCVALASAVSWFFVEKPSLARSRSRRLQLQAAHLTANYPPAIP